MNHLKKLLLSSCLLLSVAGVAVADEAGELDKTAYEAVSRSNNLESIQDAARSRLPDLRRLFKVQGSVNYTGHGFDSAGKPAVVFVVVICECKQSEVSSVSY